MFQITLICCLVLAVAEGNMIKNNTIALDSDSTENNLKMEQQRYRDILKKYINETYSFVNVFLFKYNKLYDGLENIPDIYVPQIEGCRIRFEDPKDLEKYCFSSNVPFCKLTMINCLKEAGEQVMALWRRAVQTKSALVDFIENFERDITMCKQIFGISTSNYHECIVNVISRGKIYVGENQMLFNGQMVTATKKGKKFVKELKKSLSVIKSRFS